MHSTIAIPPHQDALISPHSPHRTSLPLPRGSVQLSSAPFGQNAIAGPSSSPPRATGNKAVRKMYSDTMDIESIHRRAKRIRSPDAVALEKEIDRLSAACEEHERKIRASKATIEHRLFSDFPAMLVRLSETDDAADDLTARLNELMGERIPEYQAHLDQIVADRQADVETMKQRTTPWKGILKEEDDDDETSLRLGSRVGDEGDGLWRIEGWVEKTKLYLNSEKNRLLQVREWRKRRRRIACVSGSMSVLITLMAIVFVALRW